MLCYKGICKYKEDNGDKCTKDKKDCDVKLLDPGTKSRSCRYFERLSCKEHCYRYATCEET